MTTHADQEFWADFIQLYRGLPCLWKVKSREYCDKGKRNDAYVTLLEKLREKDPSATKEVVLKKLSNFRTSYRRELKKVEESKKSGASIDDVYTPSLWFYHLMHFIRDQELTRPSCSNLNLYEGHSSERKAVLLNVTDNSPLPSKPRRKRRKSMNRNMKGRALRPPGSQGPDLENHFILRLPPAQSRLLKDAIRQGQTNIKDRLSIQVDFTNDKDDMRNGMITFDTMMYKARLVDFPTIMESWKTIDGKSFYKTADVCQMLMVREEDDPPEEEDPKKKRRDPHKVDKKYLWPHGYTPPLKNVRKRRFRKTLRKKNLDLPEIEKEVKRLLRTDNEASTIRWEVVREEDERKNNPDTNMSSSNLDEQLFGEVLSSSDDEVGATINIIDEDEDSRLSVDDSRLSESYLNESNTSPSSKPSTLTPLVTDFSGMFANEEDTSYHSKPQTPTPTKGSGKGKAKRTPPPKKSGLPPVVPGHSPGEDVHSSDGTNKLYARLSTLENELTILMTQRAAQEAEIANIENLALKQRFLSKLGDIETQIKDKEYEISDIRNQLHD